jgi:glyoxylase-like metal-dependent hydrolase (beta-lactamase superfamily II)
LNPRWVWSKYNYPPLFELSFHMCALNVEPESSYTNKQPRFVLNQIFAFPPNRDTLGGTSYFIVRNEGNILIDCPAINEINQEFINSNGGISWIFLTHRGAIGKTVEIQQQFGCKVLIQEQEAYLLPELNVTTFYREFTLDSQIQVIWTPGHSPGSSCLYYGNGDINLGGVLFTGRHLLPNTQGEPMPLRTAKTFHWQRQIDSVKLLVERFNSDTLRYICPGANTGLLRGKYIIDSAYKYLADCDDVLVSAEK